MCPFQIQCLWTNHAPECEELTPILLLFFLSNKVISNLDFQTYSHAPLHSEFCHVLMSSKSRRDVLGPVLDCNKQISGFTTQTKHHKHKPAGHERTRVDKLQHKTKKFPGNIISHLCESLGHKSNRCTQSCSHKPSAIKKTCSCY